MCWSIKQTGLSVWRPRYPAWAPAWIFGLVFILLSASCSKKADVPEPELKVSTDALHLDADGGETFFHVAVNMNWSASSSDLWCILPVTAGDAGTTKVAVQIAPNAGVEPRNATITVNAGALSQQIKVTQEGAITLDVEQDEYEIGAAGGAIAVGVMASEAFQVEADSDWIEKAAEPDAAGTAKFIIKPNPSVLERQGLIRFVLAGLIRNVTVRQSGQEAEIPADKSGVERDAPALVRQMTVGWNLGNALEAGSSPLVADETLWGNPRTTKALIDAVKHAGFNAVRIPCAWSGYMEDQASYRIREDWLARVKEVVDYCLDNDMYAIINTHWDGGWLEEHPLYAHQEAVNRKFGALWKQVAVYFRDYDERLLFAGTNEVRANYDAPTAEHIAVQLSYNQTFVNTVRATGGRNAYRNLVVQAYNTNIEHAVNHLRLPDDSEPDRLIVEVHYYDPYDFTLDQNSDKYLWGSEYRGHAQVSSWGQEEWVDQTFAKMKTHFIDKGVPVILGEYGVMRRAAPAGILADHVRSRNSYLRYVTRAARLSGMVPFYWDSGHTGNNASGLFNRGAATPVHQDAISAIVGAVP
ncbi:endoglucanase [Parapedobacter composti]|uniref:Endoglucanase n=1 Tax=Parapedobacter composti TaxID=623281 RepID=A0A1I1FTK8_9SPHI|nr:cellulase family glycosylhydrolase [Parapedobacter composti]SFC02631.1 endoglucanase [Parapedobacter composti]